jgi:hypothetical protein
MPTVKAEMPIVRDWNADRTGKVLLRGGTGRLGDIAEVPTTALVTEKGDRHREPGAR